MSNSICDKKEIHTHTAQNENEHEKVASGERRTKKLNK